METIFLNAAGTVLFVRDDMEQGNWTQEEYSVNATFPFVSGKKIERGQRIAFRDPATGTLEMFEIRNVTNIEPEHYQQIIAEHIAISELSDDHIDTTEITDKTASQALTTALTGTLWSVGTSTASGNSFGDIGRGTVWQAVCSIMSNWNVYITPRVTVNSAGSITGRYLDIAPAQGTFRGVRLSISKNMADSSVVYDDSEVLTALYGYGGNVDKPQTGTDDKTEGLTFADVVWTATAEHPAKPSGQTYLEDPARTALYGRNGRPRFGYYQNGDIKDATVLLEKTWEALKNTCDPKISITGTVSDLYRLGYADQPMRLHDMAIVEIKETGETFQKEIFKLDVDLIDPTATRPEIGDYIPNIIYINRDTDKKASGGGGGGGGRRGMTELEEEMANTITEFVKTNEQIGMVVKRRNGTDYIQAGAIALSINQSGESGSYVSTAYINANHVNISSTDTAHVLSGSIVYDAQGRLVLKESSGGGIYTEHTSGGTTTTVGIWDKGNLTGGVMVQQINGQSGTVVKISGDVLDINGSSITISADRIDINGIVTKLLTEQIACANIHTTTGSNLIEGYTSFPDEVHLTGNYYFDSYEGGWKTYTARYCTLSNQKYVLVAASSGSTDPIGTTTGYIVSSYTNTVLHYMGQASETN